MMVFIRFVGSLFYLLTSLALAHAPLSAQTQSGWIIESESNGAWTFQDNDRNAWIVIKTNQDGIITSIRRVNCFGLNPNGKWYACEKMHNRVGLAS